MVPEMKLRLLAGVAAVVLNALAAHAQPTKIGPEIPVFDFAPAYSYSSRIDVDPGGNFVVAWRDNSPRAVFGRGFWSNGNPRGSSFQANPPGLEVRSHGDVDDYFDIAADGAGNFLIAHSAKDDTASVPACGHPCIMTRRFEADGDLSPASFIVGDPRLNAYSPALYNQTINPELAADGEGNFVVAWEGYDLGPGGYSGGEGVFARRLVGVGQVNGGPFRVNEYTDQYQGDGGQLDVAAAGDGGFVVTWHDEDYTYFPTYAGVVFRRFDKAKNPVGAQTQVDTDGYDPHIARHPDGHYLIAWVHDQDYSVRAQIFDAVGATVTSPFVVSTSGYAPEVAASESGSFVVVYNKADDASGRAFSDTGAPIGAEFTIIDGYNPSVGAADAGDFVVSFSRDGYVYAQRFQIAAPVSQEIPVLGKVAVLTNKDPDDFEKSKGSWKASGAAIVSPLRGGANDPRCLGDPDGTVKASVRFVSATSGEDHTFGLPCENWSVTGGSKVSSVSKRGYKYSDSKREDGPCNSVKIKGTKSITISCKGKPGAASFPYDLVSGQSQGVVSAVLQMGLIEHCAEFQPFFDGSDGKKYKGKAIAPPTACP